MVVSDMLSTAEAARFLSVSRQQIWKMVIRGRLRSYTIEGMRGRRFKREDLEALLRVNDRSPWRRG